MNCYINTINNIAIDRDMCLVFGSKHLSLALAEMLNKCKLYVFACAQLLCLQFREFFVGEKNHFFVEWIVSSDFETWS